MRICPKCRKPVEETWTFCPYDGTDLRPGVGKETMPLVSQKVCPKCGAKYDSRTRFCMKDGTELKTA
ncbi:MAG: zinc ribbon domain-containing protein [Gemmatimonadetes bacterium]|nr:zinc ribbon domain-containing protein [Gemmatimonadota bacterium]